MKKIAFTLAEVLIVIGIIGLVAEMTIPSLMEDVSNTANRSAWKKEYSSFNSYFLNLQQSNSLPFLGFTELRDSITSNFVTVKHCNSGNVQTDGCWHDINTWRSFSNLPINDVLAQEGFIFKDGTLVTYNFFGGPKCDGIGAWGVTAANCIQFLFDVNGFNKPNQVGKDIFGATLFKDKVLPEGAIGSMYDDLSTTCNSSAGASYASGLGCSYKVIMNQNY